MLTARITLDNKGLLEENFIVMKPHHIGHISEKGGLIKIMFLISIAVAHEGEIRKAKVRVYLRDILIFKDDINVPPTVVRKGDDIDIDWTIFIGKDISVLK